MGLDEEVARREANMETPPKPPSPMPRKFPLPEGYRLFVAYDNKAYSTQVGREVEEFEGIAHS